MSLTNKFLWALFPTYKLKSLYNNKTFQISTPKKPEQNPIHIQQITEKLKKSINHLRLTAEHREQC